MKHWFHPEARIELLESIAYYDHQQIGLGQRLLDGVVEGLNRINNYPKMYRKVAGDWRQCRIPHFPYGLIYRAKNQRIEIIAVMQLNKEPGYWRARNIQQRDDQLKLKQDERSKTLVEKQEPRIRQI